MRSTLTGMAGALFLASALGAGAAGAKDTPGVTPTEIKLGSWTALTGNLAVYGLPGVAGLNAYYSHINDQGGIKGRKIRLITEDSQYNAQQSVTAARKLVGSDGVFAIQGAFGTGQSSAALPYLTQEGVPFVIPFASDIKWFVPPRPLLIGAQVPYDDQCWVLGHWAAKDGFKNILVIHSAVAQFEAAAKATEPGVRSVSADAKIEFMSVKFGTTDYAPIALEVRRKAPDAVVFVGAVGELAAFAKEVKQQAIKTQIFSYAPAVNKEIVVMGGDAVEGLRSVYYTLPLESDAPGVKEYRELLAKYAPKEEPDYVSLLTFALAKVMVEALKQADEPLTRESLVKAFYKIKEFDTGIIGKVSFSPERHLGTRSVQPVVLKGGKWVTVGDFIEAKN